MVRVANVHDLFKCFEVENIIQSATMCAIASKERKESRWRPWHYRTDYPEKNDAEWKKHIVLTCGSVPEDVKVSYKPVIKMEGRV